MTDGFAALTASLAAVPGDRLVTSEARRAQFMAAEGHHPAHLPDAVAPLSIVAQRRS